MFTRSFACAVFFTKGIGWFQRLLGLFAAPMLVMAIIATQSRGGLLGLIAVFATIGRYKIKSNFVIIVLGLVGAILLFSVACEESIERSWLAWAVFSAVTAFVKAETAL